MGRDNNHPTADLDSDVAAEMYRRMRLIREFEDRIEQLCQQGVIEGDSHLYQGQEAVAVGTVMPLRETDYVASTHRSHGHALAKGTDPAALMAEIGARKTGLNGARGGEMHIFDQEAGLLESSAIVGGSASHLAGALLAARLDGDDHVGVAFLGDGAMNQGIVSETMNLAAIWDLPVVFVCENNGYAVSMAVEDAASGVSFAERAGAFGMPAVSVDGQDVLAVHEEAADAISRAREDRTPQFLECHTHRFGGHFSAEDVLLGEDQKYRTSEEIAELQAEKDPIRNFEAILNEETEIDEDRRGEIDTEVQRQIDAAVDEMEGADMPSPDDALENVYADPHPGLPAPRYR